MMDLLFLLSTLPSKMLVEKIMFHENLECTVLEVKAIEGLGTTMDVIVVNGRIKVCALPCNLKHTYCLSLALAITHLSPVSRFL